MHKKSLTERNQLGLYSQADLHRICGVSQVQICRLVKNKTIPLPTHRFGGKLFYKQVEIKEVCDAIATYMLKAPKQ